MSKSTSKSGIRHIETVNDPYGRPQSATAYEWRKPNQRISCTAVREHTEEAFAKSSYKHSVKCKR